MVRWAASCRETRLPAPRCPMARAWSRDLLASRSFFEVSELQVIGALLARSGRTAISYFIPTTIESGPTRCSTRVSWNPTSCIQPMQSAPV